MKLFKGKSDALFDWWSVGHFALYFWMTEFFLTGYSFWPVIIILIVIGYTWEIIERGLENYQPKIGKKILFTEKEGWWNRYVGDPIANISGFMLAWFL